MRILVVHSFYRSSLPSGENDAVRNQISALNDAGHEVAIWGPTSPDAPSIRDHLSTGVKLLIGHGRRPDDQITSFDPDIIHVHNLFPNIGTSWLRKRMKPTLMTLHNYRVACASGIFQRDGHACQDCLDLGRKEALRHTCYKGSRLATTSVVAFQNRLRRAIREDVETVLFPSEFQRTLLSRFLGSTPSAVLPNYVPSDRRGPINGESNGMKGGYLVLGRLTPEKGIGELLEFWPPGARLTIAGDGPLRSTLEARAEGLNVQFVGQVDRDVRTTLLQEATALVLPSLAYEVDPLVVPEALSTGTPCLVRDHTASALLAKQSRAVLAFSDEKSLASGMRLTEQSSLALEARSLYESRWAKAKWTTAFEALAEQAIDRF